MEQNIFQVLNETHLEEIMTNHIRNLVVVMLSSKECPPCKAIKPKFVGLAKKNTDVFFIYVDRSNYNVMANKYFASFEFTPTFIFYFGGNQIAFVEGANEENLIKTLTILKQKIEEKRQELQKQQIPQQNLQQNPQQSPQQNPQFNAQSELVQKKIVGLNKLRELVGKGVQLTKGYNLNSDLDDINLEIRFQTDPQFRQYIIAQQTNQQQMPQQMPQQQAAPTMPQSSQPDELSKKHEQVKQIQELDMLNQKMQMQSFQKLQQLKQMKRLKEQQESNSDQK
jgi:thiol-disulfide isomerase/thioredoxin